MLNIDERVNAYLDRWKLLSPDGEESDATIRAVLSHTAGIIDGEESFYGLRIGDPEVSLLDMLEGRTKYNNRPVRAELSQGTAFEYSDAGYCVLQQMILDITGKEFSAFLGKLIFEELGMEHAFLLRLPRGKSIKRRWQPAMMMPVCRSRKISRDAGSCRIGNVEHPRKIF